MLNHRKKVLTIAVIGALGVSVHAEAGTITGSWTGAFTMLGSTGLVAANSDLNQCYPGMLVGSNCVRTAVSGTLSFDTSTGAGTATVVPFSFFGSPDRMIATSISFQAIGDGFGGPGTLILGNMGFSWNGSNGIPLSIVWDAAGFFGAMAGGLQVSNTVSGIGALPESDNTVYGGSTYPIGPAVMATTGWNTTNIGTVILGTNPSGTLPLLSDTVVDATNGDLGVGGSPMQAGSFKNFNANYDIMSMHITSCTPDVCPPATVPIPAAVWLFGSGLAGLVSLARRRRTDHSTPSRME